jgi:hypothetical protein
LHIKNFKASTVKKRHKTWLHHLPSAVQTIFLVSLCSVALKKKNNPCCGVLSGPQIADSTTLPSALVKAANTKHKTRRKPLVESQILKFKKNIEV